jgi:hypothetical protein
MKLKKFSKKLALIKSTVANLEMKKIKGGYYHTDPRYCVPTYPLPHTYCCLDPAFKTEDC